LADWIKAASPRSATADNRAAGDTAILARRTSTTTAALRVIVGPVGCWSFTVKP